MIPMYVQSYNKDLSYSKIMLARNVNVAQMTKFSVLPICYQNL